LQLPLDDGQRGEAGDDKGGGQRAEEGADHVGGVVVAEVDPAGGNGEGVGNAERERDDAAEEGRGDDDEGDGDDRGGGGMAARVGRAQVGPGGLQLQRWPVLVDEQLDHRGQREAAAHHAEGNKRVSAAAQQHQDHRQRDHQRDADDRLAGDGDRLRQRGQRGRPVVCRDMPVDPQVKPGDRSQFDHHPEQQDGHDEPAAGQQPGHGGRAHGGIWGERRVAGRGRASSIFYIHVEDTISRPPGEPNINRM
jgi:hypothetical protein